MGLRGETVALSRDSESLWRDVECAGVRYQILLCEVCREPMNRYVHQSCDVTVFREEQKIRRIVRDELARNVEVR